MVRDFHLAFNHPVADKPTLLTYDQASNRAKWIVEETDELLEATNKNDIYEQADAFIDIIYFALGGLVQLGVDPEPIFKVVQKANMSKLWEDGMPHYNSDGKIIKPEGWQDPHDQIVEIINNMGYRQG
jgi:predicted HAD superfamily Cof-like phosphohydrolase